MANETTNEVLDVKMVDTSEMNPSGCIEMDKDSEKLTFTVLDYVNDIRFKHGIRSEEYGRFHSYCSKRLTILRKQLRLTTIKSNKYVREEFPDVITDTRYLEILALMAERSWAYGMLLKSQCETSHTSGPNARHRYVKRFNRALKIAFRMEGLCQQFAEVNSANNARVYRSLMEGIVHLEHKRFQDAFTCLSAYANVMDQRKRFHQDTMAISEAYASQFSQVNAMIKLCSFHLHAIGSTPAVKPVMRDEDQNAELVSIVPNADGNLEVYCRGSPLQISSQFLLRQLLDAINSTEKLIISDDVLSILLGSSNIGEAIRKEPVEMLELDTLFSSYEEVMMRITECTDTIHSEMMSSIYDQEPFRRLEDIVMLIRTLLEMEKCAIMEIMALYNLYHSKDFGEGDVTLPDCGEAVRYANMLKQQLATVMKDPKIASMFVMQLEATKTVNGMLLGMHKLANGEEDDGMALINWAHMRQGQGDDHSTKSVTRLIWRNRVCFQIMQKAGQLCSARYYKRSVAIYARKKLASGPENEDKIDALKIFGMEKRLLPCKPIIFDLAYIHNSPPEITENKTIIGGMRNMIASFWR